MKKYCDEHGIGIIELFSRFDEDGSMSVTHDEFKQGLRVKNSNNLKFYESICRLTDLAFMFIATSTSDA